MDIESAEHIASRAFGFLAEDKARITHFLNLSGVAPDALASLAGERTFLTGVLDHLMGDDALVLAFCANAELRPEDVQRAHRALVGIDAGGDGY